MRGTISRDLPAASLAGRIVKLTVVLVVATAVAVTPLSAQAANRCYDVTLNASVDHGTHVEWPVPGAWTPDGKLLLGDILKQQVLRISRRGDVENALGRSDLPTKDLAPAWLPEKPSQIRALPGGGYLLEDEKLPGGIDEIVQLDAQLERVGATQIKNRSLGEDGNLLVVYDWTPMGAGGILAFGDVVTASGQGQSSFLYIDRDGHGTRHQVFNAIAVNDPARNTYTLNQMPVTAAIGDVGYVLLIDGEKTRIGEARLGVDGIRELIDFPKQVGHVPELVRESGWTGYRKTTEFLKQHEQAAMPAAIYAWDSRLFVLAKGSITKSTTTPSTSTRWSMIEVDRDTGAEISRAALPTTAAHLIVVPGDKQWAFVEKGPVTGLGKTDAPFMEISSMKLVPADWMTARSGRLVSKVAGAIVCEP